ncbi:hypothetical protein [Pseudomonas sp.]
MLGLAEGRPLSSQKTIGKSDRLLGVAMAAALCFVQLRFSLSDVHEQTR